MPPKTKGGGKKKGASDGEVTHLHLNSRPVQANVPDNDLAKQTQKLDSHVAKCRAGTGWLDLVTVADRLKFGVYNDRPENASETNKLVASFREQGIVPMRETSAIPLIIDIKRLKNANSLTRDFAELDDVPELKILDAEPIVVASGQHRLSALLKYNQSLKDELASLTRKRDRIRELHSLTKEHLEAYKELEERMGVVMGILSGIGKWGVIVYDQGKLLAKGTELALHLSRNNTFHEYKETQEEVLITVLKKMAMAHANAPVGAKNTAAIETLEEEREGKKNARLQKVLHHKELCMLLSTRLLKLGTHFRKRHEFAVTWLWKSIDINMGLYLLLLEARCTRLQVLGCQKEFPSYDTLSHLLEEAENGNETAKVKLTAMREDMSSCRSDELGDLSTWSEVIGKLDAHAAKSFEGHEDCMQQMTPAYVTALSKYRANVIRTLRESWSLSNKKESVIQANEILKRLDSIVARVALSLTPDESANFAPEPLLGGWLMDYVWQCLTKVQVGIAEICRWFEPLLDHFRRVGGRTHLMDDWSTVMLNNIAKDQRIVEPDAGIAIAELIWTYRQSFVMRLNNQMLEIGRQDLQRPKDKKEFEETLTNMEDSEKFFCETLLKLVTTRRQKNIVNPRDFTGESNLVAGTLGLQVTSWDWPSPTHRNHARDLLPCVQGLTLERLFLVNYRPELLKDAWVGALRRLMEITLAKYVQPLQTIDNGRLRTVKKFNWWDSLTTRETQMDPQCVIDEVKQAIVHKQQQVKERLMLEEAHRDAIQKLVNHITNLPCTKASSAPNALMSADVWVPMEQMIRGIILNTSRERDRFLSDNPIKPFDICTDVVDLKIVLPQYHKDEYTSGYDDNDLERDVNSVSTELGTQTIVNVDDTHVSEHDGVTPTTHSQSLPPVTSVHIPSDQPPRPVPKPRPIPKRTATAVHPSSDSNNDCQSVAPAVSGVSVSDTASLAPRSTPRLPDLGEVRQLDGPRHVVPDPSVSTGAHKTVAEAPHVHTSILSSLSDVMPTSQEPQRTASALLSEQLPPTDLLSGFSTSDTSWYNPDMENDVEVPDLTEDRASDIMDESGGSLYTPTQPLSQSVSDFIDDTGDIVYTPTRPLTQLSSDHVTERHALSGPSAKRARAATGASSSSSTHERGSKQKKKAKVREGSQESDGIIIPI
ncbi:hypothetical protein BDR07DRAFT_1497243 [Suillus spraguei]|nr:hypothetical protein BDR07DRAFT_1497243 [Suillus spraguei]